jgi:hypothetical protein
VHVPRPLQRDDVVVLFDSFLSVGGITVRVVSDDRRLAMRPGGSLELFCADQAEADVNLRARWTDSPPECTGELLFDSGGAWQLRRSNGEFLFTFRSSLGGPEPYKIASFNQTFTVGDVQLYRPHFEQHPAAAPYPLQYPLDEVLMVHVLAQGKGVEIHGCGLLDSSGRAYVFAGQSGAGKSTLARLLVDHPGVTLLSDERVVLRTDRDRIAVYGTPWQGDAHFASPLVGDLAALFFLNQSATHRVAPIGGSRAAARLFACSFLPFHNAEAVDGTITAVEQVTRNTPCYDLWFAPDRSVVDALAGYLRLG